MKRINLETAYCHDCGDDFTAERPRCAGDGCGYCPKCCICWDRPAPDNVVIQAPQPMRSRY